MCTYCFVTLANCSDKPYGYHLEGGYPARSSRDRGYPGWGGTLAGGTLAGGVPWLGAGGYPAWGGTQLGQHKEYLLHGGRYASCVHAGGLSCFKMKWDINMMIFVLAQIVVKTEEGITVEKTEKDRYRFHCTLCEKKYTTRGHLNQHMHIHTGQYSYYCDKCRKGFNTRSNYTVHM